METLLSVDKIVSVALSISILAISLIFKHLYRSWLAPGVVFSLVWFIYTFIPLVGAWYVPIAPWGMLFIFAFCAIFSAAGLFLTKTKPTTHLPPTALCTSNHESYIWPFALVVIFTFTVTICILINLHIQGFTLESLISSPLSTGNRYLIMRYNNLIVKNIFLSIDTTLNYVAICMAGAIISYQSSKWKSTLLVLTCLTPSVLHLILYADKGTLFLGIALLYGSMLASRITRSQFDLITRQTLKVFIPCIALTLLLILVAFISRTQNTPQAEKFSHILFYFNSYFFGHLYAFSDWFNQYTTGTSVTEFSTTENHETIHYTFWIFMQYIDHRPIIPDGFYSEYYRYNSILQSNIYTMFRGIIHDFGLLGSSVFAFGSGLVFHYCYLKLNALRYIALNSACYAFFICHTYNSFIISMFSWNNPLLAIIIAYSILGLSPYLEKLKR